MPTHRIALVASTVALGAVLLTGCTTPSPNPSGSPSTSASASASASAGSSSPSPSASPSAAAIPKDCKAIVSAAVYAKTFGSTPLNDPAVVDAEFAGAVTPVTPPAGAAPDEVLASAAQLRCVWKDPRADITNLQASIGTVEPAVATGYLTSLAAQGFTCGAKYEGQQCQRISQNEQYPVQDGRTYFLRGTTWITVLQSNFATNGLMGQIVATLWP